MINQEKLLKAVRDPLTLVITSAVGYSTAFFYGTGYLAYFGIPMRFVDLEPISIVIAIFACSIFIFQLIPNFNDIFRASNKTNALEKIIWLIFLMQLISNLVLLEFSLQKVCITIAIFLTWLILHTIHPYSKKLQNFYKFLDSKDDSFFYAYFGLSYFSILTYILFITSTVQFFTYIGYFFARNTTSFQTIVIKDQNYAVIGYQQTNILIMPIDSKQRSIIKELNIYPIEDLTTENSSLILTETKNLHVDK